MTVKKRKRITHVEGRAKQREKVLTSEKFLSGDTFTRSDVATLIGMSAVQAHNLLRSMADDGLVSTSTVGTGRNGSPMWIYRKPPPKLSRMPWRTLTNESIGVPEAMIWGR